MAAPVLALIAFAAGPAALRAQGYRGHVDATVQVVELRPLALDTVPTAEVQRLEDGSLVYQGLPAACGASGVCTVYGSGPEDVSIAGIQDLAFTTWGLGVQGLSVTALLRLRESLGSDVVWPRSDDEFDALVAYAQWVRGPWSVRAGRQELRSGLGFAAFDGGALSWRSGVIQMEAYGGRSLARGLREPANEALRGIEAFVPDESVHLFGGAVHAQWMRSSLTARYHREILGDRSGLVSERGSVDLVTHLSWARLSGSLDYDFGFQRVGKSRVSLEVPLAQSHWLLELSGRRYLPYFELSTIWGFFEPVAYSEVEARIGWSPATTFGAWASGGWRRYGEAGATVVLRPLEEDGWRTSAGARWSPAAAWSLDGSYRLEWGPGGFLNSVDVNSRYRFKDGLVVGASAMSFQQIEEFRVGDGRAFGAGLSFELDLTERLGWSGGVSLLRHRAIESTGSGAWNQTRGWSSIRVEVGEDPGLANRRQP